MFVERLFLVSDGADCVVGCRLQSAAVAREAAARHSIEAEVARITLDRRVSRGASPAPSSATASGEASGVARELTRELRAEHMVVLHEKADLEHQLRLLAHQRDQAVARAAEAEAVADDAVARMARAADALAATEARGVAERAALASAVAGRALAVSCEEDQRGEVEALLWRVAELERRACEASEATGREQVRAHAAGEERRALRARCRRLELLCVDLVKAAARHRLPPSQACAFFARRRYPAVVRGSHDVLFMSG